MTRRQMIKNLEQQVLGKLEWADHATVDDTIPLGTSQLRELAAAAERVLQGGYGDCMDCEQPIPLERLKVKPEAVRCVRCQSRHESRVPHMHGYHLRPAS